jgi:hypothetical protein
VRAPRAAATASRSTGARGSNRSRLWNRTQRSRLWQLEQCHHCWVLGVIGWNDQIEAGLDQRHEAQPKRAVARKATPASALPEATVIATTFMAPGVRSLDRDQEWPRVRVAHPHSAAAGAPARDSNQSNNCVAASLSHGSRITLGPAPDQHFEWSLSYGQPGGTLHRLNVEPKGLAGAPGPAARARADDTPAHGGGPRRQRPRKGAVSRVHRGE